MGDVTGCCCGFALALDDGGNETLRYGDEDADDPEYEHRANSQAVIEQAEDIWRGPLRWRGLDSTYGT